VGPRPESATSGAGSSSEHWWLARKPLAGTVAANVLAHGTGALNIDGCRVPGARPATTRGAGGQRGRFGPIGAQGRIEDDGAGRWPTNAIFSHAPDCAEQCAEGCPVAELDRQSGDKCGAHGRSEKLYRYDSAGFLADFDSKETAVARSEGGASRFFPVFRYQAKASTRDRSSNGAVANTHATVKPTALMAWLCRLVTPPGGLVLDPFCGSGSTGVAAVREGFRFLGIEREPDYVTIARARIAAAHDAA
jgi:hypothetical protein